MKKIILSFTLVFASLLNYAFAQTANPDGIVGTWTVSDGTAKIKIEKSGGKYVGKIVSLNPAIDKKTGLPPLDKHNKDKNLQSRPLMGLSMLDNFTYDGGNVWTNGTIYDPDGGDTYSCKITLTSANSMDVRGYIGISLFGRTDTWKRSTDDTQVKQNASLKVGK